MTTVAEVEVGLERANVAVDAARELLTGGGQIDLAGLEAHVAALCADIASLARDDGESLRMPLLRLIDGLNGLAGLLAARREDLSDELKDLSSRHRAVSAYGRGGKSDRNK